MAAQMIRDVTDKVLSSRTCSCAPGLECFRFPWTVGVDAEDFLRRLLLALVGVPILFPLRRGLETPPAAAVVFSSLLLLLSLSLSPSLFSSSSFSKEGSSRPRRIFSNANCTARLPAGNDIISGATSDSLARDTRTVTKPVDKLTDKFKREGLASALSKPVKAASVSFSAFCEKAAIVATALRACSGVPSLQQIFTSCF